MFYKTFLVPLILAWSAGINALAVEHDMPYESGLVEYDACLTRTLANAKGPAERGKPIRLAAQEAFYFPREESRAVFQGFDPNWLMPEALWRDLAAAFAEDTSPSMLSRTRVTQNAKLTFKTNQEKQAIIPGLDPSHWLLVAVEKENNASKILIFHRLADDLYGFGLAEFLDELTFGEMFAFAAPPVGVETNDYLPRHLRIPILRRDTALHPTVDNFLAAAFGLVNQSHFLSIMRITRLPARLRYQANVRPLRYPALEYFCLHHGDYAALTPAVRNNGRLSLSMYVQDRAKFKAVHPLEWFLRRTIEK